MTRTRKDANDQQLKWPRFSKPQSWGLFEVFMRRIKASNLQEFVSYISRFSL